MEVTLEICTLFNGLPHGLAIIQCTHPEWKRLSFRGVGVFNNGQLHNAPFTCMPGDGWGYSFTQMHNGRPADGSYCTYFNENGESEHVDSLETKTDVSGW